MTSYYLTTDSGDYITTDDGYLIVIESFTSWTNNDVKTNSAWINSTKNLTSYVNNVTKNPTSFVPIAHTVVPWQSVAIAQIPYLYDSASVTYNNAYSYDYTNPQTNQLNTLKQTVWSAT